MEDAHYNLGITLRAQGQLAAARKELEDLTALREFRTRLAQAKLRILQGVEALKREELDDALTLFQKAVEQSPELPTDHYYLGIAWSRAPSSRSLCPRAGIPKRADSVKNDFFQKSLVTVADFARRNHRGRVRCEDPDVCPRRIDRGAQCANERRRESVRGLVTHCNFFRPTCFSGR